VVSNRALEEIVRRRAVVGRLSDGPSPRYGISTGFGVLAQRYIAAERRTQLLHSLTLRAHD
jgi:histidine ammonia-lyase